MNGITELKNLLENMSPELHNSPYVFLSIDMESFKNLSFEPLCYFREQEGITIITEESNAEVNKFIYDTTWACITLRIHSSLAAVGFMAAITTKLTEKGISVNPVSAFYHDHLFVPWEKRFLALDVLAGMR